MKRCSIVVLFVLALTAVVHAQMEPRKPEPELKKLAYFEGSWKLDGDMKQGPMGPGGPMTMTENCEWMEGNFFLVCHSDFKSAMGTGKSIAFMGWDPNGKTYTYDDYGSMGDAVHSPGTVEGDTWTFTSEEKMGGVTMKGRWVMKVVSPTSYTFKYEMSQDGTKWMSMMEGKATKS